MPHKLVRKVVFEPQIVNAVDGHSANPQMMHRDVALERHAQVLDHVPMDGVSAWKYTILIQEQYKSTKHKNVSWKIQQTQ